ncbi:hypothetical protein M407DRAFT_240814 [Tulasnella calospora MUT 4182]|uniref:Dol-P-Man:Man(5)GlcNAc(2)-PP-Dol alpha-1,3-mannosyltransferase n=1 Tax=Tulasnella calospora MUT 4182 TaxID=1051891 RepID=A0A0C3QW14_9AGAM|nr:hypothetical protein M407DRAFT_240814 [Tulasnella calospora MUT 4182]
MLSHPDHGILHDATVPVDPDDAQPLVAERSRTTSTDHKDSTGHQPKQLKRDNKAASDSEAEMVNVKLSPTLKQLLSLRNPLPQPGPSAVALNKIFAQTLGDLRTSSKSSVQLNGSDSEGVLQSWVVVATTTLLTTNSPSTMGPLYHFVTRVSDHGLGPEASTDAAVPLQKKVERVALMREAGLKCAVLTGVPKVINTLGALREALESDVKSELDAAQFPRREVSSQETTRERGAALFESIYNPHSEKLLSKLGRSHPDFPGFIIEHAYGGVLSNPSPEPNSSHSFDTPLISRTLTSALAVACLRAQGGVGPQLISHVFGLLKAHHEGNQTPIEQWISTEEGAEWVLGTVDKLCDVVRESGDTTLQDSARL